MDPDFDDVCDTLEGWEVQLSEQEYVERALEWAESMTPGQPGRAELFFRAGERLQVVDRDDEAAVLYRKAVSDGGRCTIDPRAGLLDALHALDRHDEARALLVQLRNASRDGEWQGVFHEFIAEILEEQGDLPAAQRWFNLGLRDLDLDDSMPTVDERGCLRGRYRVRRTVGLPKDRMDALHEELTPERSAPSP